MWHSHPEEERSRERERVPLPLECLGAKVRIEGHTLLRANLNLSGAAGGRFLPSCRSSQGSRGRYSPPHFASTNTFLNRNFCTTETSFLGIKRRVAAPLTQRRGCGEAGASAPQDAGTHTAAEGPHAASPAGAAAPRAGLLRPRDAEEQQPLPGPRGPRPALRPPATSRVSVATASSGHAAGSARGRAEAMEPAKMASPKSAPKDAQVPRGAAGAGGPTGAARRGRTGPGGAERCLFALRPRR